MRTLILGALLFSFGQNAWATHIKGGFISTRQINGLSYIIELNLWLDMNSSVEPYPGNLTINGKSILENVEVPTDGEFMEVGGDMAHYSFSTTYTFSAPGTYELIYKEFNRDAGIINMVNSVDVPFVIRTSVKIDPILGNNTGPKPNPHTWGRVSKGNDFYHFHSFSEPDGDSLSYHMAIPLASDSSFADGHQFLSHYADDYYLSPYTGEIQWINPNTTGKFAHSMVVREWRKTGNISAMISESQFDILLTVDDSFDTWSKANISFDANRCASIGEPIQLNIEGPASAQSIFISTDYQGSLLLNADLMESRSITLDYEDNLDLEIEFLNDHPDASGISVLNVAVADTSNLLIGSRAITLTEDCSMLPTAVITSILAEKINPFSVFPNPTSNLVKVDLSHLSGRSVEIQMYNSVGQEVYWDRLIADETALQFAVAGLPRGIYLLKVEYDKKQYTQRIVLD